MLDDNRHNFSLTENGIFLRFPTHLPGNPTPYPSMTCGGAGNFLTPHAGGARG